MKEIDSCYYKEEGDIILCFTKRDMDAKSESELKGICEELGINLKNIKYNEQVHGSNIIEVDEMSKVGCSADALITDKENVPLMIFTADCVPLVFYDKVTNVIALAHAGWKGTYANIAKNTVNTMINKYSVDIKNIEVIIGPSISRDNYQVSKELIERFSELNIDNYYTKRNDEYYLDLWTINKKQLENIGVLKRNIIISNLCTVSDNDKFFSYRKDNKTEKRIGTIIQIRGKKMKDRNLIEQVAALKKIPVNDGRWRLAFYHIATEFWNLDEHYVIVDKESYENGMNLPLVREHKGTCAVQIFSSYNKAQIFIEETKDMFVSDDKPLIGRIRKGAFQEVFSPFFAEQRWNYMLNDGLDMFLDTFERLIAVVEASENYIVDEKQEKMLEKGDIQAFFADICNDYIIIV